MAKTPPPPISKQLLLQTTFLPPIPKPFSLKPTPKPKPISITSTVKIVRTQSLDRHIVKQNKLRFVQKLKTLILSKPHHYIRLRILSKCRSYLSLPRPRSLLSMIKRYPSIFQIFESPSSSSSLAVRLTPAAASLAAQESALKSQISTSLATKLQKLLMLSSHRRLLLSKLVHLAPDLGLPPNFRSRLCNDHPDRFKTVDTSYGRALELVDWDSNLASAFATRPRSNDLIIDRPLKFKQLRLRKGLNLKRGHRNFLIKFGELPEICPYTLEAGYRPPPHTMEAEKRACAMMREVLGMTVEKRTLIDHLTHFRKEFGLSNKLRGMLVRHPELFYVSLKGMRDSVFLVEGYDDKGGLMAKDELLVAKERLMELVREGKRMRRERRRNGGGFDYDDDDDDGGDGNIIDDDDDGFSELFEYGIEDDWEDFGVYGDEECDGGLLGGEKIGEFWTLKAHENGEGGGALLEPW
eukprot:TRINITY_DN6503_c0_g1_i1.p1 TRINITY_DN6503_c0_g1~~TRINITY_DN6503_c0_g1_i1.p1  ORF type:complete len:476 (-),score=82.83 TRINITY_DN6503_c0_g1_i1:280-1677(-)